MFIKHPDHKNGAKKLPGVVQDYMWHRFNLVPLYLDTLRCFEYDGIVNGKEVKRIRIFSPNRAKEQFLSIKDMADLDTHAEMLLFEGYIDSHGGVYVADRRPPIHLLEKHNISGGPGAGKQTNILQPVDQNILML